MTRLTLAIVVALAALTAAAPQPRWNGVADNPSSPFTFTLDTAVSDEFSGTSLNTDRWDVNGLRNPDSGCPKWNGPTDGEFSSYYPTEKNPDGSDAKKLYQIRRGKLFLFMAIEPQSFFEEREYYCDENFKCNHDQSIDCFATNFDGNPVLNNNGEYAWKNHGTCKIAPYCIPHYEFVQGASSRSYQKFTAPHLAGKTAFKYGFFETKIRLGRSSAVSAVWMHRDDYAEPYSRYVKAPAMWPGAAEGQTYNKWESPSFIRNREWQEIDIAEAMNPTNPGNDLNMKYIPNVHAFANYKGRYTSATEALGPVILDNGLFNQKNPLWPAGSANNFRNQISLNYGSVKTLPYSWEEGWHVLGTYWSPSEIRFLYDGVEVFRMENTVMHQDMFMSLSMAFNRGWAGVNPRDREVRGKFRINYIRRWVVTTSDPAEADPPSSLPMNNKFKDEFNNIGSGSRCADGRFPLFEGDEGVYPTVFQTTARFAVANSTASVMRQGRRQAGGRGNTRRSSRRTRRLNSRERRAALSNEEFWSKPKGKPAFNRRNSIAFTDEVNPMGKMAGWATTKGDGRDIDQD